MEIREQCIWAQDGVGEDHWDTGCRGRFTIMDGSPSENKMRFCCYCGKPLEEHIATDDPHPKEAHGE